ncbi:mycofactocin biosynthesis glycosyltransferase MftF [Rhodococcus sp. X156]|uniref:mycofactocin biosynthesis glycosyltransferase MftF n=1 Tax=Rhodococcus sp. X156 TaxID=2499145 RepID=UPI000FD9874F|nr:mycofactocin biosynthesis glycosyltransferase MftF [Rhodococcus sp. X156]
MSTPALPLGFRVQLDRRLWWLDRGAAVLGGSPPRLLRLRPAARERLAEQPMTVRDSASAALARTLLDAGVAHPRPVGGPTPEQVTVVVPVRDNAAGVQRLLAALTPGTPVVVVDDGSGSAHRRQLATVVAEHGAELVRHPTSRGPAAARNTGLARARTPFVAFLDSDVVPTPGWLTALLPHLADPAVALVAPRIVALPAGRGWVARYETLRSSLDLGPREAGVLPRSRVAYVPSAALLVRVAAVSGDERGCFAAEMSVAEDVDLCWRLHARGWRLRYEPAARVAHQHRTRVGTWLRRKAFYGTGAAPLAARHPRQVPPVVLAPWTAVAAALLLTGRRTGVTGAVVVTAVATVRLSRSLTGLHHPLATAAVLAPRGLYGALTQLASAAWRSYWPVTLLVAALSPRARRVLLAAGVLDGLADWATHRDTTPRRDGSAPSRLDPLRYLVAKRLDDLAYGTGLWWGALRAGEPAALRPELTR